MISPALAIAQSVTAGMLVTAQVIDYCNIDSTTLDLLSVTCSLNTPMVASATGTTTTSTTTSNTSNTSKQGGSGSVAGFSQSQDSQNAPRQPAKSCDNLAAAKLENESFNQFALNIAGHSAGPAQYFSTFEVCF